MSEFATTLKGYKVNRVVRKYFGKPGPILVWQAATRTMNATVPQSVIDEAIERDPASANAEYLAMFAGIWVRKPFQSTALPTT